jgi:hypothetical protein
MRLALSCAVPFYMGDGYMDASLPTIWLPLLLKMQTFSSDTEKIEIKKYVANRHVL